MQCKMLGNRVAACAVSIDGKVNADISHYDALVPGRRLATAAAAANCWPALFDFS